MTVRPVGDINGTTLVVTYDDELAEVILSDSAAPEEGPYRLTSAEFFAFMADGRRLARLVAMIERNPSSAAGSIAADRRAALAALRGQVAASIRPASRGGRR